MAQAAAIEVSKTTSTKKGANFFAASSTSLPGACAVAGCVRSAAAGCSCAIASRYPGWLRGARYRSRPLQLACNQGSFDAENSTSCSKLVSASKLALGEQFSEEKIKACMEGMQRSLQEGGYFQASIEPLYEWDSRNQQVKVLFVVNKGKQARVGQVLVTGSPGYSAEGIRNIAKLRSGDLVTAGKATRALKRLRQRLKKQDRLEAQVVLTQRVYHAQNNSLDYTFDITRGPAVDIKVEGAKLRRGLMKKLVPVFEENAVDDDLLNDGARNIQDYFQTKGYFDVKVSFAQKQAGEGRLDVFFRVEKNARHKFADLVIQGNRYFRREEIRERLAMQPAGGLLLHGPFSHALLDRYIPSIA